MKPWRKENFSFHELQRIMFRLIERVEVFSGLSAQELQQVLEACEKCTFDPGEIILREGSSGAYLYVLIEGQVSVQKAVANGQGKELAELQPGEAFGEISLLDRGVRSASVIARSACILLRLSETECWRHAPVSAKIYRNIGRILARRLRDMDAAFVLGHLPVSDQPPERSTSTATRGARPQNNS